MTMAQPNSALDTAPSRTSTATSATPARILVYGVVGLIALALALAPFLFPDIRSQEVAARTIDSILSALGTPWTSETASGDGGTPAASARTVPVAAGPTVSSRTVYSRPAPSLATTVSPGRSLSTRVW